MTQTKKEKLLLLVQDCITFRFNEKESLDYIQQRNGKIISRQYLYKLKKELHSDETLDHYFNEYARIGYIIDQRNRLNEMEIVMGCLMKKLQKMTDDEDITTFLKLAYCIRSISQRLDEISDTDALVTKIVKRIDSMQNPNLSFSGFHSPPS